MRFTGHRPVPAPASSVWAALHDTEVLRAIVPGCREMAPLGAGTYAATMSARVGPIADTYRGTFDLHDLTHGSELVVAVAASGRCGRIAVDLRVGLSDGSASGTTVLRYAADASVSGFVSRLGTPTLTVAGGHFTGSFFRGLERSVRRFAPVGAGVA
jgi:uncharacterized protein